MLPGLVTAKITDYPPEIMRTDGNAMVDRPDDLRVSPTDNGWAVLSVLAGDPVSEGTLDVGLNEQQVGAALSHVEREWVPGFLN